MTPDHTAERRVQSIAETFASYHDTLARRVRAVVDTSDDVVGEACWMAYAELLHYELSEIDAGRSWLTTLAIREAVRLNRGAPRMTQRARTAGSGERSQAFGEALLTRAAVVVQDAGLTATQLRAVALHLWGLSDERIAGVTGETRRVVERSVTRGREKLVEALRLDST